MTGAHRQAVQEIREVVKANMIARDTKVSEKWLNHEQMISVVWVGKKEQWCFHRQGRHTARMESPQREGETWRSWSGWLGMAKRRAAQVNFQRTTSTGAELWARRPHLKEFHTDCPPPAGRHGGTRVGMKRWGCRRGPERSPACPDTPSQHRPPRAGPGCPSYLPGDTRPGPEDMEGLTAVSLAVHAVFQPL